MPISAPSIVPAVSAIGATTEAALQPGTVVDATVLEKLAGNAVRLAIADLALVVQSELPLEVGQVLSLAVTQTQDGLQLALATPDAVSTGRGVNDASAAAARPQDSITLAPAARANRSATLAQGNEPVGKNLLSPAETAAVVSAAQSAATRQTGLSNLFADLAAAVSAGRLPAEVRQAAVPLVALQVPMRDDLGADSLRGAFQRSGVLFESRLAAGILAGPDGIIPDLKAALVVLRQALASVVEHLPSPDAVSSSPASPAVASRPSPGAPPVNKTAPGPSNFPDVVDDLIPLLTRTSAEVDLPGAPRDALAAVIRQIALQAQTDSALPARSGSLAPLAALEGTLARAATPPIPFRGALPAGQPVAAPMLRADADTATTARQLLVETDGALARQTLLQVASLPSQDANAARADTGPRWAFEIPFAVPQGTAVAQFEIARDGGGAEEAASAPRRVWRARFSVDVEPAGPVHALVSLTGDRTSVRMWAERPATFARLREGTAALHDALRRAELQPGDIIIQSGAPPQPPAPSAGHFLDRAS